MLRLRSVVVYWESLSFRDFIPLRYETGNEARPGIFDYIEKFYNTERRHSTLSGLSPVEFDKRYASLTVCL